MLHTANLPLTLAKVSLRQVCPAYRSNTPKERNLYHGICSSERWTAIDADRAAWESLPDVKIRDGKSHKEMSVHHTAAIRI